jgi:1-acyl-sn-glycerol-3-phosphate acyltransferase
MVFPEGERFWERVLYPGAGVLARRARVPLIPVGLENACCYHPQAEAQPLLAAAWRIIRETREKGTIRVHFGSPLMPDPRLPEREDVDRLMRGVARVFGDWDRRFYGFPPPQWPPGSGA